MREDDPLDRPVDVDNHGRTLVVRVRPADVLAALDDEQAVFAFDALDQRLYGDDREGVPCGCGFDAAGKQIGECLFHKQQREESRDG